MNNKNLYYLLSFLILTLNLSPVFFSDYSLEIKYVMLLLSMFSSLLSLSISHYLFSLVYNLFSLKEKVDWPLVLNTFYFYFFLNTLFFMLLQYFLKTILVFSIINPLLLLYLFILSLYLKQKSLKIENILYAHCSFYILNFFSTLIGVLLQE